MSGKWDRIVLIIVIITWILLICCHFVIVVIWFFAVICYCCHLFMHLLKPMNQRPSPFLNLSEIRILTSQPAYRIAQHWLDGEAAAGAVVRENFGLRIIYLWKRRLVHFSLALIYSKQFYTTLTTLNNTSVPISCAIYLSIYRVLAGIYFFSFFLLHFSFPFLLHPFRKLRATGYSQHY